MDDISNLLEKEITFQEAVDRSWGEIPNCVEHLRDSDKIYWWSTPNKLWRSHCGRAGVAVVRENEIVAWETVVSN